jgi:PelA/Pel-15E family pectate lyase
MKNVFKSSMFCVLILWTFSCAAQKEAPSSKSYLDLSWKVVATRMPSEWYGSTEAKLVAENVLIAQKEIGGWAKNIPYHHILSEFQKAEFIKDKSKAGATFDNGATTTELRFLAKVYSQIHDPRYKQAFDKGVNYFFIAQYKNGGWPQYFPVKDSADEVHLDHTVPYSMHITYNDDAMANVMQFLKDIFSDNQAFASLQISKEVKAKAQKAFDKGIECFLKTQIIVNNKPTVWCAQHNEITLAPANARAYELASFSGSESVGILLLLMDIDHPSKKIIASVNGAITWFENHKIEGIKIETEIDKDGLKDKIVVEDKNAPTLWARFYDLQTEKPFFCSRDGIKKSSLAEISYERRNGYGWYTNRPEEALKKYPEWVKKWNVKARPIKHSHHQHRDLDKIGFWLLKG